MELINNMEVDPNGGINLKFKYDYYTYSKLDIDGVEHDNIEQVIEYVNTGLYILLYVNTNQFYTGNTNTNLFTITNSSTYDWFINYINTLATSDVITYEYENIIIYNQTENKYYYIKYYPDYYEKDIISRYSIITYDSETIWDGISDNIFSIQLDNCGNETGIKSIKVKDININSNSYGKIIKYDVLITEIYPEVSIISLEVKTSSSIKVIGKINNYGDYSIERAGFCYGRERNPTFDNSYVNINNWKINYSEDIIITGLSEEKYYYIRPFIEYAFGIIYGESIMFKTMNYGDLKIISSNPSIGIRQLDIQGEIYNPEEVKIDEVGVCWSEGPVPTILDNKIYKEFQNNIFINTVTNLTNGKKYNFKSYIKTTNFGVFYGNNIGPIRIGGAPVLADISISADNIGRNYVTLESKILDSGWSTIKESGFYYIKGEYIGELKPTEDYTRVIVENSETIFKKIIIDLEANTNYSVMAYSINDRSVISGTTYTNSITFKTNNISTPILSDLILENATIEGSEKQTISVLGTLDDNGGSSITTYGIVYGPESSVLVNGSLYLTIGRYGTFKLDTIGIINPGDEIKRTIEVLDNTTYYFRTYAENEKGISYSNIKSIKTDIIYDLTLEFDFEVDPLYVNLVESLSGEVHPPVNATIGRQLNFKRLNVSKEYVLILFHKHIVTGNDILSFNYITDTWELDYINLYRTVFSKKDINNIEKNTYTFYINQVV